MLMLVINFFDYVRKDFCRPQFGFVYSADADADADGERGRRRRT